MRRRNSPDLALRVLVLLVLAAATPAWAQELGGSSITSVYGPDGLRVLTGPSNAEVVAGAPAGGKPQGSAVIHCKVGGAGALADCAVTLARGSGFGPALLALAPKFRVSVPSKSAGEDVVVTASWPAPDTPSDWRIQPKPGDFSITYTDAAWKSGMAMR